MIDNNVLEEFFVWEEKNLIEQKNNCLNNTESVHYDTTTEIKNDLIKKDWRDITDPKKRQKAYRKAWYESNKNKIKSDKKAHYELNKDIVKKYQKDYYQSNKNKVKKYKKNWYDNNKDKVKSYCDINRDKVNMWKKTYDNKTETKFYKKEYRKLNKEKQKTYKKNWHESNKEKVNIYYNNKRKTDIQFKLQSNLRSRLHSALKDNRKVGSAVKDLGCTIEQLKSYLESKFLPGMTWDNWTTDGWHIDHIKPLSSFDLTDRKQLLEVCHYTNLQPLWAKDNLIKSDKLNFYLQTSAVNSFHPPL